MLLLYLWSWCNDTACSPGIPYGHWFAPQLLLFVFSSLRMHLGKQWRMAQVLGPKYPCGRLRRSSFQAKKNGSVPSLLSILGVYHGMKKFSFSPFLFLCLLSAFQTNKVNFLFKKLVENGIKRNLLWLEFSQIFTHSIFFLRFISIEKSDLQRERSPSTGQVP